MPEFESDGDRSYFLIRLPAHAEVLSEETPVETSGKTSEKASEKMSEKILAEIRKHSFVTIKVLSQRLGITTRSVERNLKKLHDSGPLKRVGPARGGHWAVKERSVQNARGGKVSVKASGKTSEKIVAEIRRNRAITIDELARHVGVTTRSVERNLKKLQASGILKRVGPAKGGHWVIREDD